MIDIHCHILPAVDDGAKNWEMTLEMCRIAQRDGITHIVATPHANDEFPYHRAQHEVLIDQLRSKVPELAWSLGCDFHLSIENIDAALEHPDRYTIGNTRYLLVEFSDYGIPHNVLDILGRLHSIGLTTIITHPERNPILARNMSMVAELVAAGCLVQVTANSITGFWGKQAQKVSETLLRNEQVHVIASDAHDPLRRRPVLSEARQRVERLVGKDKARLMFDSNPRCIVDGQAI